MSELGWRRRRATERQLRTERPQPSDELVASISATVAARRPRGAVGSRIAFAAAITTFMLGTFASFGGLSYAASGASTAARAVERVVVEQVPLVRENSAAADQYGDPNVTPPAVEVAKPANRDVAGTVAGTAAASGVLPFTGLSLATTLLISLGLIGAGVALRRRELRR
jgi:hypothetical protein